MLFTTQEGKYIRMWILASFVIHTSVENIDAEPLKFLKLMIRYSNEL